MSTEKVIKPNTQMINAWMFISDDHPSGTDYYSDNSCYQSLIKNNVYQSVDMLFICFANTIPYMLGEYFTIEICPTEICHGIGEPPHPINKDTGKPYTNIEYVQYVIRDAKKSNPNIKIMLTLRWDWNDEVGGGVISRIFPNQVPDKKASDFFADKLLKYLKYNGFDGFDIDWEFPVTETPEPLMSLFLTSIRERFDQEKEQHYYLTLSPTGYQNLNVQIVNKTVDFINLQTYGGATKDSWQKEGFKEEILALGVLFEGQNIDAERAYNEYKSDNYSIVTAWRLNSTDFDYEQEQQCILYSLVKPKEEVS